jgi:lipid II:glycine glycyltransferase (peptidoglycan interpeptide bridge formation enzyme)
MTDNDKEQLEYRGNGWSKYQLMVLKQLEDHAKLLDNLNKQYNQISSDNKIAEINFNNWKHELSKEINLINKSVDRISTNLSEITDLQDKDSIGSRLKKIETEDVFQERLNGKTKALWGMVGAAVVFLGNILVQVAVTLWPK